jgi:predicted nuclease with TOPRIM domain
VVFVDDLEEYELPIRALNKQIGHLEREAHLINEKIRRLRAERSQAKQRYQIHKQMMRSEYRESWERDHAP